MHLPARPPATSTVVQTSHCCWPHPNTPATLTHRPPGSSIDSSVSWLESPVFRADGAPAAACLPSVQPRPHWTLPEAKPALAFPLGVPLARSTWGPMAAPAAPAPRAPLLALHVLSSPTGLCLCLSWPRGVGVALLLPPPPRGSTWLTHSSAHQGADLGGQGASSSREPRG